MGRQMIRTSALEDNQRYFSIVRDSIIVDGDTNVCICQGAPESTRHKNRYHSRIPRGQTDLGFSVEVATTSETNERQRIAVGLYANTLVRIKYAYRLRPHDLILDYGNALDKEQEIISAVMDRNFSKGIEIRFVRATRRTPDSQEYIISEIELQALHTISLS